MRKGPCMRRSWSPLLLLAGALASLTSVYLAWQKASCGPECLRGQGGDVTDLLNLFPGYLSVDGWSSEIGDAAALTALLLAALAAVAVARPNLESRLPLGLCALVVAYLGLAVAAQTRSVAHQREVDLGRLEFHYAYGAYLGVAGGVVALLAAAALRREELVRNRVASQIVALGLGVGVLVSLLLPWQRVDAPQHITFLGIETPAAFLAAVAACLAAVWWMSASTVGERLSVSAATALFTVAAVSAVTIGAAHVYGAWLGLGLALALLALALRGARALQPARPPWHGIAAAAAASVLLAALFLPWQKVCYPTGSDLGPYSGRCLSTNGWVTIEGSAAAALATLLVVATLAQRRPAASAVELTVGIALLVATLGFQLAGAEGAGVHLGYGSIVGFAAAALLLILAFVPLRFPRFELNRLLVRLAPITLCLAYLAIIVLPWWDVLPRRLQSQSLARFAPISWLTVAGALLAILLLGSWARRIARSSERGDWLVLIPLGLLALAALDIIRLRDAGITWGSVSVVGLCLLLALLGRVEQRDGLESLRVPEILRVDRLGPPET